MRYFITLLLAINLFAQDENVEVQEEEIKEVVNKLLSGVTNYDVNLLKQAFHPDAKLFYVDMQNNLKQLTQSEWYSRIKRPSSLSNRKNEIVTIDITGKAAMVKTRSVFSKFEFVHYLSLMKTYGQWLIVNKIFYRIHKE